MIRGLIALGFAVVLSACAPHLVEVDQDGVFEGTPAQLNARRDAAAEAQAQQIAQAQEAAEAQARALASCQATPGYRRYAAAVAIEKAHREEAEAQAALARERRVADTSGVVDMSVMHAWGQRLVMAQDNEASAKAVFQHYGGQIGDTVSNPCVQ